MSRISDLARIDPCIIRLDDPFSIALASRCARKADGFVMVGRGRRPTLRRTLLLVGVQVAATLLLLEVALRLIRPHHAGLNNVLYLPSVSTDLSRFHNTVDLVKRA